MNAEIIAVGTELLLGDILNTNAQYLSKQLAEMGFTVHHQSVVGDNPTRLFDTISHAKSRSDLIILSGGLGPTEDDLTKETVAKVFNDTLVLDEDELNKIKQYFVNTKRTFSKNNEKQAYIPSNGMKLINNNGTAPGVVFKDKEKIAILLPGPPKELVPMFKEEVVPYLEQFQNSSIYSINLNVFGIGESLLEGEIKTFLDMQNPTCALYAKQGEVRIRVTAKAKNKETAKAMCLPICEDIKKVIGDKIYSTKDEDLETVVVNLLKENNMTISIAESCTGGLLSSKITDISGASEVLGLSICTYSNENKIKMLGVKKETIEKYTEVSKEVATEMAIGINQLTNSTFSIATTGYAGPTGGTSENPIGTVYIAVVYNGETIVKKISLGGRGRSHVKFMACQHALNMVRQIIIR